MNVVIRVDSSLEIGTGHVMRCLTLAEQLRKSGFRVHFICRQMEGNISKLITEKGFNLFEIQSENITNIYKWYQENWQQDAFTVINLIKESMLQFDIMIVDHYGLDVNWESTVKPFIKNLMVIDDLANRKHDCNILLDQNYKVNFEIKYKGLVPNDCKLLLGPNYVLLRDEFVVKANFVRPRSGQINRILVFFGGTDPTNETIKTLKALSKINKNIKIDIIIGATNNNRYAIKTLCDKYNNFQLYSQVDNISEFMGNADLAIGAGGATTWERCFMGLPSLTIVIADNQKEVTDSVAILGATINLGDSAAVDETTIYNHVKKLLKNPKIVENISKKSMNLVNPEIIKTYPIIKEILEVE